MTSETPAKPPQKPKKKTSKKEEKFLVKRGADLFLIPGSSLASLPADEVYKIGMASYIEQRQQLMLDALHGDHFLDEIKVVDRLETSLRKLEEIIPDLVSQLEQMGLCEINASYRVGKC